MRVKAGFRNQQGEEADEACILTRARLHVCRQFGEEVVLEAFIDDPVQKARIKKLASVYLSRAGARAGNIESFCRVGRDEIARGTLAGSLIRSDV